MKIAIVGYGKMGKLIEQTAVAAGHEVVLTADAFDDAASVKVRLGDTDTLRQAVEGSGAEGIIEFTSPASVVANLKALLATRIPIVVGTTGWQDSRDDVAQVAQATGGTLVVSANFSVGVNVFYKIVQEAARLANAFSEYDAAVWEMHHNMKADSPSGTALETAQRVLAGFKRKDTIVTDEFTRRPAPNELHVSSTRCGSVPGTHKVIFDCPADTIEITHTARSRQGFAVGALHALENLVSMISRGDLERGRLYGMSDVFPSLF